MVERNLFKAIVYLLLLTLTSCSYLIDECEDEDNYPAEIENEVEYFVEVHNSKKEPMAGVSIEVSIYRNWCSLGTELVTRQSFLTDADGLATGSVLMRYSNSDERGKWFVTAIHGNLKFGKFEQTFYQGTHTLLKTFVIDDLED